MIPYIELSARSAFSVLEGASLPETLVDEAARLELPALALTDVDGVYRASRFHKAAQAAGVRPLLGAALTLADEDRWDEAADPQLNVVAYTAAPRERAHGRTRRRPAMEYVGIDLHKKESPICLLTETGEVIERRIRTEPQRFAEVLGGRRRARILVEASTEE